MRSWRNALVAATSLLAGAGVATGQTWQPLTNQPTFSAGAMLLLTDGTVLVHAEQNDSQNWYKLTPDINGSYVNGERITDQSALNDGDVLRFGDTVVRFRAPADAAVPLDSEESGSLPRPATQG